MQIRLLTHLLVILVSISFMIRQIAGLASNIKFLICLPYLIINFLDIYFLIKALKNKPRFIDRRISSIYISSLVSIHPIFVILFSPSLTPVDILRQTGALLNFLVGLFIIWALLSLKSNLTVLPEANSLVKTGPYKYIRHPLYFAYVILAIDEVMIYQTFPVSLLALLQFVLILIRAKREEIILYNAIPEYKEYYKKTAWFNVPWAKNNPMSLKNRMKSCFITLKNFLY